MLVDKALMEAMIEIGLAIENNQKQKDKVEQTGNEKQINVWLGQEQGLKYAMQIISEIRNKHLQELRVRQKDVKAVKKTLTIPAWLDELSQENNINFSQKLQEALKEELGL